MKLLGDPKRLGEESVMEEFKSAKGVLDEALSAAIRLVEDAYRKALKEAESMIEDEYSRITERLSSKKSSLDLELKNRVALEKSKYIDEVMEKAIERMREMKGEDWYKEFLKEIVLRVNSEMGDKKVILSASADDIERLKQVVEEAGLGDRIKVSPTPIGIIGGVVAESEDGSERLDYSLDLIIRNNETRIRALIARVLFS
ncbi:MAG: hypothetical protein GSR85_02845 [Desulfurococcales archaeon]|nr:hypothetical protein [Desulfurococcales archaeon]